MRQKDIKANRKDINDVVMTLLECTDARSVTKIADPRLTIVASRRPRDFLSESIVLTIGRANWKNRQKIKLWKKAAVNFPRSPLQIVWYKKS